MPESEEQQNALEFCDRGKVRKGQSSVHRDKSNSTIALMRKLKLSQAAMILLSYITSQKSLQVVIGHFDGPVNDVNDSLLVQDDMEGGAQTISAELLLPLIRKCQGYEIFLRILKRDIRPQLRSFTKILAKIILEPIEEPSALQCICNLIYRMCKQLLSERHMMVALRYNVREI